MVYGQNLHTAPQNILPTPAPHSPRQPWEAGAHTPDTKKATALGSILREESLDIHFQPIVSLKKKTVIGVEALARPRDPASGRAVPPQLLFGWADREGRTLELDRLCRHKALKAYPELARKPQQPLLFLNFEASLLDKGVLGSCRLYRAVLEAGLSPEDVVIEINESKVIDLDALKNFVDTHRRQGFLIALDDLGAGFSNLTRIFLLKPEILKLDRSLIMGLENDFYKQEIFKSLVGLGRRVGSLILAEGVETEEEVSACVDLGADLVQGYFFGRPAAPETLCLEVLETQLNSASFKQRQRAVNRLSERRRESGKNLDLLQRSAAELSLHPPADFDPVLEKMVEWSPSIECLYVLDRLGAQVTRTVESRFMAASKRSRLFTLGQRGTDHSAREYFYSLMDGGLPRFVTDVYLSLASGKLCRTLAYPIKDSDGTSYVLCMDLNAE